MGKTKPYDGLLGLDRLPGKVKGAIWSISFVVTIILSIRIGQYHPVYYFFLDPAKFPHIFLLICGISVCLRLAGIRWRYAMVFIVSASLFLLMVFFLGYIYYSIPYFG